MNLLAAVLFLPLAGFLCALAIPRPAVQAIRGWALAVALATFGLSLALLPGFDRAAAGEQFLLDVPWIATPNIHFAISVNGVSLWLVLLSTLLTPICVLISWNSIQNRAKEFFAFLLLLEFGLIGVFLAQDLFLFYVFWEVTLVPMYFLIGIWGHERRIYAAVKFFLYTMAGSVLMLVAIIYIYNRTQTFSYPALVDMLSSGRLAFGPTEQFWLFLAFFVAFAIKVPIFPLHTWLPDAHVEAPVAGSVMLASVMLKMGTYGILHFCVPLFPSAARECAPWIVVLAIIGIVYGALVAMVQPNMKKLVAYSSVSHLGFVVLGIFSFTQMGLDGAVYQMLNHGISTGALFVIVGLLYERRHSLAIEDYGGVASQRALLAGHRVPGDHAGQHRAAHAQQFRRRIPGAPGSGHRQFQLGGFCRPRRDPFRLLYALALPAGLLRRGESRGSLARVRFESAGVGGGGAADRHDGLDGRLFAEFSTAGGQSHGQGAGPDAGERALPGAGAPRGGCQCPLIKCSIPPTPSGSCRKSFSASWARS